MPFPWKKAKVNRISRLVADLHQSPKRGGSLVVETGFPTSLIDLFVKNQDRLRRSSRRKSNPSPQIPPDIPSPPKSSLSSPQCIQEVQSQRSQDVDVGKLVSVERAECEERIGFQAAFKVFLVVALAVGTPTLAVWIMMAAFLLVLLEFVGTRFFGFLRPQSLMLFLGSRLQQAFLGSRLQKDFLVLKKRWDWGWEQGSQQELVAKQLQQQQQRQQGIVCSDSCEEDGCIEEIQIVESKFDSVDEGCERISDILEKRMEILICKSERNRRRDRIKANLISKFVPKKLRKGKKKSDEISQSGVDMSLEKSDKIEDDGADHESQVEEVEVEIEVEEEEESCKQVAEDEGGQRISSCSVEVLGVVESEKGKSGSGSGHLILPLLGMVLVGLLGGRGLSLLLALVCCLVVRYSSSSSSTPIRFGFGFGWFRLRSC